MTNRRLPPGVRRLFRLPWRTASRLANDADEELRFHIDMRAAELAASGLSAEEAVTEAWRRFGDDADVRRHAASISAGSRARQRVGNAAAELTQDLRFAGRQIRRAPMFAIVAVMTLALGIGANSAIFSVIHHLLLAPLPYADGNRMVELLQTVGDGRIMLQPDGELIDGWRARTRTLESIVASREADYEVVIAGHSDQLAGAAISPGMYRFLGVRPAHGREFNDADARPGAPAAVMIGYALWQQQFAGAADVLGKLITVDSLPRVIVGVAPPGFVLPFSDELGRAIWTPLATNASGQLSAFGKLRRGVTAEQASKELAAIAASLPSAAGSKNMSAKAMRAQDYLGTSYRSALLLLFGAVGVVLLIACANVANLLLVRGWSRQREFAIRTALGAGRARVARQVLAESLVLSVSGAVVGLALAWGALHIFVKLRPDALDKLDGVRIEPAVLLWTTALAVATGLLFGAGPAMFASVGGLGDRLKAGARAVAGGAAARRVRGGMIVGEIALSVMLLVSAGLLVRSFRAMQQTDVGFDPHGLAEIYLGVNATMPKEQRIAVFADFLARLRATPGIDDAVEAGDLPPRSGVSSQAFELEGRSTSETAHVGTIGFFMVQPGFFRVARIHLRGHTFSGDSSGRATGPGDEVIVSEQLARRLWPAGNALGSRMRSSANAPWVTVVGVAQNLRVPGRTGDRYDLQIYYPMRMIGFPAQGFAYRSALESSALAATLRQIVQSTSSQLRIVRTSTSETELQANLAGPRFAMAMLTVFALAALVLSTVGLYSVIAYTVSQRTREIGVRVALGAQPRDVARLVFRQGTMLAVMGIIIGVGLAAAAGRAIRGYLVAVGPGDPLTYVGVALLLGVVALCASYVPARRAMRVDPAVALGAD